MKFRLRLARLFRCTLGELAERLPLTEMPLWIAEWQDDPWGDERAEISRAIVGTVLARCLGAEGVKLEHLLPRFGDQPADDLPDDIKQEIARIDFEAAVKANNRRFGGE